MQNKNIFSIISYDFSDKDSQRSFHRGQKEKKDMKEEGLWQNQNNWILGWVKKPGIISHKENLMEKSKELIKTNQNSPSPISKGKTTRARRLLQKRDKKALFHNSFDKDIEAW